MRYKLILWLALLTLVCGFACAETTGQGAPEQYYTSVDQLDGKRIALGTGTTFDDLVKSRLPNVSFRYYNSYSDIIAALDSRKIDAFVTDEPVLASIMKENSQVAMLPEYLDRFEFGFMFPKDEKGAALAGQMSEMIRDFRENGELDRLEEKWLAGDMETAEMPDIKALGGENGRLTLATDAENPPFVFVRGTGYAGYEVELILRFCERYGYGLTIKDMAFDAVLATMQTGKADIGAATISITEERKESVFFSDSHYTGGTVLGVLKAPDSGDVMAAASGDGAGEKDASFWGGIASSFNKTFIREERWRLFVEGVLTTLLITVLGIAFGTALGFGMFMLCRNGNPFANLATRFCLWLVQGMPMVVLLMVLYYIIFGSVAINGVAVAVIGFTLTFGAAVFGLLKMGVGAVENGQYEAAYALGYSNRRTFFRIILPQALPHVLPAYKGEIVGLIKATAIVGYIAVQDLTKMGDIVRSRTYEAFFPLIAVTVIYFLLEGLIGFLVSRIDIRFDPKRRKAADILRGIKADIWD